MRRIAYIPGMISVAVLIPLFAFKLISFCTSNDQRILEVSWFVPGDTTNSYALKIPKRKYSLFELSGNGVDDEPTLDSVSVKVNNILQSRDSITGVSVKFSDSARYESFVRTIGFSRELIQCIGSGNKVYIFFGKRLAPPVNRMCGTSQMLSTLRAEPSDPAWPVALWPMMVMFALLCTVSVRYVYKTATTNCDSA